MTRNGTGSGWVVELEAGVEQVEIARDGYTSWVTSIELSPSEFQTIRVVLEKGGNPAVATLVLDSDPSGATVLLDGKEIGKTPIHQEIAPGQHTVALQRFVGKLGHRGGRLRSTNAATPPGQRWPRPRGPRRPFCPIPFRARS